MMVRTGWLRAVHQRAETFDCAATTVLGDLSEALTPDAGACEQPKSLPQRCLQSVDQATRCMPDISMLTCMQVCAFEALH